MNTRELEGVWPPTDVAERIGMRMARRVFAQRGDHTEVHLGETELAMLLAAAADIGRKEAAK